MDRASSAKAYRSGWWTCGHGCLRSLRQTAIGAPSVRLRAYRGLAFVVEADGDDNGVAAHGTVLRVALFAPLRWVQRHHDFLAAVGAHVNAFILHARIIGVNSTNAKRPFECQP